MKFKSKSGAVLGALVVAALVAASANTLSVTSPNLGADSQTVSACDSTGIDVAYNTQYNVAGQFYEVTDVRLLGVEDACIGQLASVTLGGADGVDVDTDPDVLIEEADEIIALIDDGTAGPDLSDLQTTPQNATPALEDFVITLTTPIDAELILNIAIVIA